MSREIEIKLPRCILVLTEAELMQMLKDNSGIWQQALVRGKSVIRARQAQARTKMKAGDSR
jgi:hypothetical protein